MGKKHRVEEDGAVNLAAAARADGVAQNVKKSTAAVDGGRRGEGAQLVFLVKLSCQIGQSY